MTLVYSFRIATPLKFLSYLPALIYLCPFLQVVFQNLQIFHLSFAENHKCRELVAELFPNLPFLEELVIEACLYEKISFNIVAPVLKTFSMSIESIPCEDIDIKVVVDAPLLQHFCLEGDEIAFFSLKSRSSRLVAKISIGNCLRVGYSMDIDSDAHVSRVVNVLSEVANAKSLSMSGPTMLALACSQTSLPAFHFLTKLDIVIPYAPGCKLLLLWLANAPNLEVLIVGVREHKYDNRRSFVVSQ